MAFLFAFYGQAKSENEYWLHEEGAKLFIDNSQDLDFKTVQKQRFKTPEKWPSTGFESKTFWVQYNLKATNQKRILEVITPQTESIQVYIPLDTGISEVVLGSKNQFSKRKYLHKNFIADLPQKATMIYIKVNSPNNVGLLFKIRTQSYFTNYSLNEYLALGMYYGILILLVLYNLLLFASIRDKVYLWYSLAVLMAIGISLTDDGLGFQYIWSEYPKLSQPLGYYVFPIAFLLFYAAYAYYYLPKSFYQRKWLAIGVLVLLIQYVLVEWISSIYNPFSFLFALPFLLIYLFYWYCYSKGYRPARFFLIGNTFAIIGVLVNQMRLLGWMPGNIYSFYAFEAGMVLEFVSLSLALADRYKQIIKQKNRAVQKEIKLKNKLTEEQAKMIEVQKEKQLLSEKVNRELEEKVQQRTEDLAAKNDQLNDLVSKLKELNIGYDKENWALKLNIKEEKKKQLLGQRVTFDEFLKLYPTDERCRVVLAEYRWNRFVCELCGSASMEVQSDHSAKCSSCSKKYSINYKSLFQYQKLPLTKLMYLTYLFHSNAQQDIQYISEEIDVSTNSIYSFRKKVMDVKNEQKNSSKNWMDLIF